MAGMPLAPDGLELCHRVGAKVGLIVGTGYREQRCQLLPGGRPVDANIRIMVQNIAEQLLAVGGIALGIQDVGMPEKVDQSVRF